MYYFYIHFYFIDEESSEKSAHKWQSELKLGFSGSTLLISHYTLLTEEEGNRAIESIKKANSKAHMMEKKF